MRVLSLNVGLPQDVLWQGRVITTGIFKTPVSGRIWLRELNFEGDRQADLTVHGGPEKAVYAYPFEHYDYWRRELPGIEFSPGIFGENLTSEGLLESEVHIGDRYRIGTAELVVTQPRLPCYKLGVKFRRTDMVKRFADSRRTGFYFSVTTEGQVAAGDAIQLLQRNSANLTITDIVRLYLSGEQDNEAMRRAAEQEGLPVNWREYFRERLKEQSATKQAGANKS